MSGRGRACSLTSLERRTIEELLREGRQIKEVAEISGRSPATVSNVKKAIGLTNSEAQMRKEAGFLTRKFLQENWHWKNPKEENENPEPVTQRSIWKRKGEKSDFRTPYCYPGRAHF